MKRILFTFLLLVSFHLKADLPVTTNAVFARFASSYFTTHRTGDYIDAAMYMYWWTNNIHCYENSRGGAGIQEANENRMERKALAQWANGQQFWGEMWADDNGGYNFLQMWQNSSNSFLAPGLMWNGTSYTNEGGWAGSHTVNWIGIGAIPYTNNWIVGCSEQIRDAGMTNAATLMANKAIEFFTPLCVWSNDTMSGANTLRFGTPDVTHPGPPANVDMAIVFCTNIMDTNINTCVLNFNASSVTSTQHCVVSGMSLASGALTFTWKADRHSMAFDIPDGTITNDARGGFLSTNAWHEDIVVANVPNGPCTLVEDGVSIFTTNVVNNTFTVNLYSITNGAVWNQRKEVLGRVRDKRGCDRVTLVDDGSLGEASYNGVSQTQWDAGKRGDVLVSSLSASIASLNAKDALIWAAATPTNHTFVVRSSLTSGTIGNITVGKHIRY